MLKNEIVGVKMARGMCAACLASHGSNCVIGVITDESTRPQTAKLKTTLTLDGIA